MKRISFLFPVLLVAACEGGGPVPAGEPPALQSGPAFVNWENLSVFPVDLTPDGSTLLVCNTADNRLEIFDVSGGVPVPVAAVPVGLDPVSVRARSDTEAWVVNHISDSVSVVDLAARHVVWTLDTLDEPADVVFAGARAFVSCSQANAVQVFSTADLTAAPETVPIEAEDPRALAVSADGSEVYVAIFESGNGTTALTSGLEANPFSVLFGLDAKDAVGHPGGPHGGVSPPPNDGVGFNPPLRLDNPPPPHVSLIVRQGADGLWRDDTGADWTEFVSGVSAPESNRPEGWTLLDRDIAVISTADLAVSYAGQCMNMCAALAVQPGTGRVTVVGADATNEVRFEPVLNGRFLRVRLAAWDPVAGGAPELTDLNPHLDYTLSTVPQDERDRSLGDPRGIAWNAGGTRGYVTGMGSNNVAVIDAQARRVGRVEVGEGPTGIRLSADGSRAYVLNRFEGSVSVIDTAALTEVARVAFFDPTPVAIRRGRKHLYDTHKTSGLGYVSCASCHIDARMDRLAWDLGDPSGEVKENRQNCQNRTLLPCEDFHPMKGPLLTQTLQDIIGKEPHHWRGDRDGIEEFNGAYESLLGDDRQLTAVEMQEFEDFLATIHFPPNPFRNLDNSLPTDLPLPMATTPGRFGPAGLPLPNGNAERGLALYRTGNLDGGVPGIQFECSTCHTLPTGISPDIRDGTNEPAAIGPNGERHHALVALDSGATGSLKTPHLRNLYERTGLDFNRLTATAGFGYRHNGTVDTVASFLTAGFFTLQDTQELADVVALMMAFSGSGFDEELGPNEFAGPPSLDTHAAVGRQVTFGAARDDALLDAMLALADARAVDVVAKGPGRGWLYDSDRRVFQSDRQDVAHTVAEVRALAAPGNEITFTVVPEGAGLRIGVDRDDDGTFDGDEIDAGTNPADPES